MCSLALKICLILMSEMILNASSNSGASLQLISQIGQSAIAQVQQTIKNHIKYKINNLRSQIFTISNPVSAQSSSHDAPVDSHSPVTQHGYNELNSYYNYDLSKFEKYQGGYNSYDSSPEYYEQPQSYQYFNSKSNPEYHY